MNKKTCQNRHARRRAAQRFGLNLGPRLHDAFVRAIQGGIATFVERQSQRISLWDLVHEGEVLRLVYDRHRKQVVTVLSPHFPNQKPTKLKVVTAAVPDEAATYDWHLYWEKRQSPIGS